MFQGHLELKIKAPSVKGKFSAFVFLIPFIERLLILSSQVILKEDLEQRLAVSYFINSAEHAAGSDAAHKALL